MMLPSPQWTGKPFEDIYLNGVLMPVCGDKLVTVEMPGCQKHFVILFSTKEKLDAYVVETAHPVDSIKQITDGQV
jgi:hypothetical protein